MQAAPSFSLLFSLLPACSGILAPKVAEASFEGLRGAQALQEVAAGELFVSVPRAAALVVEPRQRCPCPDFVGGQFWKQAPWYAQMAILLLRERSRRRQSPVSASFMGGCSCCHLLLPLFRVTSSQHAPLHFDVKWTHLLIERSSHPPRV